jgi:phosphoribosylglycinamide formyltransferase-1
VNLQLGFLASGGGTNMASILAACQSGALEAEPRVVIGNNSKSGALARGRQAGIPVYHLSGHTHPNPEALDKAILRALQEHGATIVCLVGYMKLLGRHTLAAYRGRILNIHPALLPKFGGKGFYGRAVHEAVLAAAEKESGATIHLVDEEFDHGPVLAQARVPVHPGDTAPRLAARVLEREHVLYAQTLQKIATGEISLAP